MGVDRFPPFMSWGGNPFPKGEGSVFVGWIQGRWRTNGPQFGRDETCVHHAVQCCTWTRTMDGADGNETAVPDGRVATWCGAAGGQTLGMDVLRRVRSSA
eukprot:scaffold44_cov339-Pavlova_lutheri.AAC.45